MTRELKQILQLHVQQVYCITLLSKIQNIRVEKKQIQNTNTHLHSCISARQGKDKFQVDAEECLEGDADACDEKMLLMLMMHILVLMLVLILRLMMLLLIMTGSQML